MKVGSICYATSRGLGHLCHDFYLHGLIQDVLVIVHLGVPTQESWYPDAEKVPLRGLSQSHFAGALREFCAKQDAMLFFETPFEWSLLPFCAYMGVRTYLVTMYECTPEHRPHPRKYVCPSALDVDYFKEWNHVQLNLPVEYLWRLRTNAHHFIHNGGYLGVRGREGTENVIEAWRYVKSPARLTVRVQENVRPEFIAKCVADPRIQYVPETVPYHELYATGDVAIGAQKWNGCSLPLQEARASGMLVMNTDRYPINTWLPTQVEYQDGDESFAPLTGNPLIPVRQYVRSRVAGRFLEIDEAVVDPQDIAAKVDEWYGRDISEYSKSALEWAETMSWAALKPRWLEALST